MRFRFCGDADCPDWVLAQINSISRLSSIKLKLLAQIVADAWIDPKGLNVEKIRKLLADAKLDDSEDLKATVACIQFILRSAVKHNCDELKLASELQQIGLPQEHSQALRRIYVDRNEALTTKLRSTILRLNRLQKVEVLISPVPECVHLRLHLQDQTETILIEKAEALVLLKNTKLIQSSFNGLLKTI